MDLRAMKLKHLKKRCKRAKRKTVALWKTFGIFFLILTLLAAPLCLAVIAADNVIATQWGGTFWKLKNRDESAVYFQADDLDARELAYQVMAEGAVLLKNDNKALPLLAKGSISCYGITDSLKTALEEEGFAVYQELDTVSAYQEAAVVLWNGETEILQKVCDLKVAGSLKKIIVLLQDNTVPFLKDNPYQVDSVLWIGDNDAVGAKAVAEILSGKVNPSGSLTDTFLYETAGEYGYYTGYKYYETRYEEGDFAYADTVAYPFGHGLSYTTFAHSDFAVTYDEKTDKYAVSVTVTNTGPVAGKQTIQVYGQTPYTDYDRENGVEKPSVSLVGFGKTKELAPGRVETVIISVDKRDLASYDANGARTYILGEGSCYLTVATDAHGAVNNILTAKGVEAGGDAAFVYTWEQAFYKKGAPVTNRFAGVQTAWVSRRNWEGEKPELTPAEIRYNPADYPTLEMPTLGAENGLKLYDMVGVPFDDAQWQTILDQLTFVDMLRLLTDCYGMQMPIESVQAPGGNGKTQEELELPTQDIICATFNTELVQQLGKAVGNQCLTENIQILYCQTGAARCSDSFLMGKISAAQVAGIREKGILVTLEVNFDSWMNEQAAREISLRKIQYALEQDDTVGVVTDGFCADILRQEWGSKGQIMVTQEQDAVCCVMAGATAFGQKLPLAAWELYQYENDPIVVTAMRQACHYNLYTLANSSAMNGIGENTTVSVCVPVFVLVTWIVAAVVFVVFVFFALMWRRGKKRWKKSQEYLDYQTMRNTLKEEKKQIKHNKKAVVTAQNHQIES